MKKWMTCVWAAFCCCIVAYGGVPEGWTDNFNVALSQARQEKKLVLVLFTGSDWCPYCVQLHEKVLSQKDFKSFAEQNLVLLYLDFPRKSKADNQKRNQRLAKKYRIRSFPTTVLTDANGREFSRINGAPANYMGKLKNIFAAAGSGR